MINNEGIKQKINEIVNQVKEQAIKILEIEGEKSIVMNFEAGGRPMKWTPRKYETKKQKGRKLLVIRGFLKNVRARKIQNGVQLVTDVRARDYAQIHNEGGVINMPARSYSFRRVKTSKGNYASRFAGSRHKRITKTTTGKAYQIVMPKREFMIIPEMDYSRILEQLKAGIKIW